MAYILGMDIGGISTWEDIESQKEKWRGVSRIPRVGPGAHAQIGL